MPDIMDLLLEYYEKGLPNSLFCCLQELSPQDIRVIVIEILGWLKLERKRELWIKEGKKTKLKPLILNYNYMWCQKLREIVDKYTLFNQYFYIVDNRFDFSPNIAEEDRQNHFGTAKVELQRSIISILIIAWKSFAKCCRAIFRYRLSAG